MRITNPYLSGYDDAVRLTAYIPPEEHKFLRQILPERGFYAALLNTTIKLVVDFCQQNNITYYTPENARKIHEFLSSRLRFDPVVSTTGDTDPVDDSGASPTVCPPTPRGRVNSANSKKRNPRKQTGKTTKTA